MKNKVPSQLVNSMAASFDVSSGEHLSVASNPSLQTGDVDFWLAGWFKFNSFPAVGEYFSLVSKYDGYSSAEYDLYLYTNGPGSADIIFGLLSGGAVPPISGVVPMNQWIFILAWQDFVNRKVAFRINNGIPTEDGFLDLMTVTDAPLRIGADSAPPTWFLDGMAAAVGFGKNPPLGIADIITNISASLYNGGNGKFYEHLTASERTAWGLVSYWNLNEESDGSLPVVRLDSHGTNHLTDNNNVASAEGVVLT